jgi:hypothetical protein
VAEHAYTSTRRYLLRNFERLEPVFARHGIKLRRDVLEQERDLWTGVWEGRRNTREKAREKTRERQSRNDTVRGLDDVLSRLEALVEDRMAAL